MARLAAVAKALYYPTSEDATARILRTVTLRVPAGRGRILDVCAGEGQAVAALAAAWGLDAYGVELDAERATSAQTRMYRCLRGSYNQLHASKGSFHALFCNPPYDAGQDGLGNSVRLEVLFLQAATEFLATDGLLVLVVPRAILHNEKFKSLMRSRYYAARAFDYPLPERDLFDQVVVVARRQNGYAREIATTDLAVLGEDTYTPLGAPVEVKQTADLTSFVLAGRNPYDLAPSWQTDAPSGVYASSTWDALVGHAGNKVDRPLMPPRPGHQAMLLAAGALNGAEIRGRYLIKGSSEKVVDTVVEEGDKQEGDEGAIVERERVVSRLAVLDLRTGEFDAWRVNDHLEKTAAWFRDYGTDLAQAVRQLHTPEFDGNLAPYEGRLARLHAPGILPGHTEPEILQIQKEVAAAVSFHWRGSKGRKPRKTALLSGEMGTGKTSMATAAVELYGAHRAVVVCPAHLVRKWIREVETITGCKGIAVAGKKLSDVDRFFAGTGKRPARYLVLSKEIAKLGTRWEAAFTTRTEVRTREVPDVEAMRVLPYWDRRVITKQVREVVRVVACPQCGRSTGYTPRGFDRDNHQYCADCRSPLWTATALNDRGSTRWPLAEYIGQRYARRYVLVVDECFPGWSLVSTARGRVPIKDLRVGDFVWSRTRDGQIVLRRVVRVLRKPRVKPLVRVSHQHGSFVCTDDHKVWTEDQLDYTKARCLIGTNVLIEINDASQDVPLLQDRVSVRTPDEARAEDVQPEVWCATSTPNEFTPQEGDQTVLCDLRVVSGDGTGPLAQEESDLLQPVVSPARRMGPRPVPAHQDPREDEGGSACAGGQETGLRVDGEAQRGPYDSIKGERIPEGSSVLRAQGGERVHHAGAEIASGSSRLGDGRLHPDARSFLAHSASGPRSSDPEDRGGVRWSLAPYAEAAQPRPTEGTNAAGTRLDGAAVLELRDHEGPRPRTGENPRGRGVRVTAVEPVEIDVEWVYDLEVEDTHNYFVEGILVSNCHKFAGAESDQSRAIQDLASGAHKILAMTGTLYGGRASSLFYLLYKVEPSFRDRYGFKDCARFSQHFGLFETRYDLKASTSRYGTRRGGKRSGGRTKEIPGMSPAMIPLLLPYTIFVKLKDLRQELPPYAEDVRMVDHDPTVLRAIASLSKEVRKVLRKHPKVLGQYLQTCLGYPDCPEQAEEVWDVDAETGARSFIAEAPAFPRAPQPKDIEVVRIVREERAAGRQVLVFFAQTHKRDARGRVREALEAEGFRVEVLDASVQPDKREEWLEKACARGFDVLLTNGRLVETGLDLLFAKTIVQYGTEYSVPILRQSVRRSWRLGQIDPIRVVFLAYRATMQEVAMNLIARKMRAAEMVDGDETGGLADYDSSGANFFVELAQEAVASVLAEEAKAA